MKVVAIKFGAIWLFNRSEEFIKTATDNPKVGTVIDVDLPSDAPAVYIKRAVNAKMLELTQAASVAI